MRIRIRRVWRNEQILGLLAKLHFQSIHFLWFYLEFCGNIFRSLEIILNGQSVCCRFFVSSLCIDFQLKIVVLGAASFLKK